MNEIKVAHIATIDKSLHFLLFNQMLSIQSEGFSVYAISSPGPYVTELEKKGIRHIAVSIPRSIQPFNDITALWKLYTIMRQEKFTIVHTHFSKPGMLGQVAARLAGVPVIVNTIHGFAFHENMREAQKAIYIFLEKIAAACSTRIFSQNNDDLALALEEGICKPEKIRHLGNGIDLSRFDPRKINPAAQDQKREALGLEKNAPVIGFLGRLAMQRKGFGDFLAAAKMIKNEHPETQFLVIGDSDQGRPDAAAPEAAKGYGVYENCRFVGWVPNDRVPLLLSLMDVLVLPSSLEGMPRSLMEASAMGVPIVATNVKGNRDVVIDGVNGLLVPYANVPALSRAILELMDDPGKARAYGKAGRKLALERFDETAVFEKVKQEYRALLQGRTNKERSYENQLGKAAG